MDKEGNIVVERIDTTRNIKLYMFGLYIYCDMMLWDIRKKYIKSEFKILVYNSSSSCFLKTNSKLQHSIKIWF